MMEYVSVALGVLAAGGQVANYILHLRIKTAILESEAGLLEKVDQKYVRKETCEALHSLIRHSLDKSAAPGA